MIRTWAGPAAFLAAVGLSLVVLFTPASGVPSDVPVSDKVVHGALFALLAATGLLARLPVRTLAPALVAYAAASEVLQSLLPIHRDGDVVDWLADTVGVAVVLGAAVVLGRRVGPSRRTDQRTEQRTGPRTDGRTG